MKIEFSTDGAAFYDEYEDFITNISIKEREVVRILKNIINDIKIGCDCGSILDINGNKIGEWSL